LIASCKDTTAWPPTDAACEPSAFDAGHCGAEGHGLDFALALGQRQRKAAVESVAGANSPVSQLPPRPHLFTCLQVSDPS
jgi:hypothetical protein